MESILETIRAEAPPLGRLVSRRDPRDLIRLLLALAVVILGLVLAGAGARTEAGFESDIIELIDHLPRVLVSYGIVVIQVIYLGLVVGIPSVLIIMRRWNLLGMLAVCVVLSPLLTWAISRALPAIELPDRTNYSALASSWPHAGSVASFTAVLVILSAYLTRRWIRFGWLFLALLCMLRVLAATQVVRDLVLSLGVGATVGFAALLIFGRTFRVATPETVGYALRRAGIPAESIEETALTSRTSAGFHISTPEGRGVFAKVIGGTGHQAESLVRSYRQLRLKDVGEDMAYATVRHAAAGEGVLALLAHDSGVRTPALRLITHVSTEEILLGFDEIVGQRLSDVPDELFTDGVLDQMWLACAGLGAGGMAHRDLNLSSWMLDGEGTVWLIDFSMGEAAATEGALAMDVAELLAATYTRVGAERAVAAALRAMGPEVLGEGIPRLVTAGLTLPTRTALKKTDGKLAPLVKQAALAAGVEEPEFADLERIKPRSLITAGLLVLAVYVLLPQFADLPHMIEAIRDADPRYAAYAALASLVTYVGSGMAISSSAPGRVPLGYSWLTAVAATFVGAVAPPGIGHAGLNVRFLQKQGLPAPVAISATAVKEVGVASVHVLLLVLLAIVAGSSGALEEELHRLPSAGTIAIGLGAVVLVLGVLLLTPPVRRVLRQSILPALQQSWASLAEVASSPTKIVTLVGGGVLLQVGYISALYFAVRALGGDAGFATIGLIYLTVGSVAAVAPTPGGVGAVEAVLLAALTGIGMDATIALAAVFLYRLVTFWIPIPLGAACMRILTSRDAL